MNNCKVQDEKSINFTQGLVTHVEYSLSQYTSVPNIHHECGMSSDKS